MKAFGTSSGTRHTRCNLTGVRRRNLEMASDIAIGITIDCQLDIAKGASPIVHYGATDKNLRYVGALGERFVDSPLQPRDSISRISFLKSRVAAREVVDR